jgi:hypothetical protein
MKSSAFVANLSLVLIGSGLLLADVAIRTAPVHAQTVSKPTSAETNPPVRAAMKNVDFHLTDTIVVHIASLDGALVPDHGEIPVFDDKQSFHLKVDSAAIQVTPQTMSNTLNEYVFAKPDAPLKNLSLAIQGDEVMLKGVLASKGGIHFETDGTMSVTPNGKIRVHTLKVRALHLQVKGLLDMFGLDTAKLIDTKTLSGVTVDKDDLILDPELLLPPPKMRGHLTSIQIVNGQISMVFGAAAGAAPSGRKPGNEGISSHCGARNFQSFRGGTVRFGKLTMTDADMELMDSDPSDPFDFSIDHYQDQLVAGYSKSTKQGGLCVHMPDYGKLKRNSPAQPK